MEWFFFALLATTLFGVQSFLYKSAIERGANKFLVTFFFMLTVEILALVTFLLKEITLNNFLITLTFGVLFAGVFYLKTLGQLKALEYLPTNKVFPITSSAVILTVILALFLFQEALQGIQVFGILIIVLAIMLMHRESQQKKEYQEKKVGFLIAFLTILPAAGVEIINKYAALHTSLGFFILASYFFAVFLSLISHNLQKKKERKKDNFKESIKMGMAIGIVNFVGYFSSLTAMKTGPLSLIAPLLAASVLITIILAKIIHKEELTLKQFLLVVLVVVGIIFLRI